MMIIPGLGSVTKDTKLNWYISEPIKIPLLNNIDCTVCVEDYDDDPQQTDFHVAISNLLNSSPDLLKTAEEYIFQYYVDVNSNWDPEDDEYISISSAKDVWKHVQLGNEPLVSRRAGGDKSIYVSIECNCDWETEHGLQLVFRNGNQLVKVGPYDGHLTNADAYADPSLENVIYR